jgi:hypothetical protein
MTRRPLRPSLLISNKKLANEISTWKRQNSSEHSPSIQSADPPEDFICSFTREVMVHPVVSRYGDHFERAAIQEWFAEGYDFCPVTGKALRPAGVVTDGRLKEQIKRWKARNGYNLQNYDASTEDFVQYGFLDSHFGKRNHMLVAN